jgi:hypothetical protein
MSKLKNNNNYKNDNNNLSESRFGVPIGLLLKFMKPFAFSFNNLNAADGNNDEE